MNRQAKAFLTISSSALGRLQNLLQKKAGQSAIKVGVKRRGCNGLSYTMNYASDQDIDKFDEVIEQDGVKVVVDSKALMALVGTRMDFVEDEIRSEFVFENPNSKGSCGCGESFHI